MNRALAFLIINFLALAALANNYTSDNYPFPYKDPLVSTVFAATNNCHIPYVRMVVEPRPDRRHVPLSENRNKLTLGLFTQKNPHAPLVFIVAGVGGDGLSGSALLLAEQFASAGYAAVTLPDPLSWQYVLSVSESAAPGFLERDAAEYYDFLKFVRAELRRQYGVRPEKFALAGYSFGGLMSGFLAREDSVKKEFNFSKVLLMNPAMDLEHGIDTLDSYYAAGDKLSESRKNYVMASLYELARIVFSPGADLVALLKDPRFQFSANETKWIIGNNFREDLRDIIFVGQQVRDTGVLKISASKYVRNARSEEAKRITFKQYIRHIILPSTAVEADGTVPIWWALNERNSLYALRDLLLTDKRIVVFENADDILLKEGDLEFLSSTLGERFYQYPYGGHMGNLAHPINRANLIKAMASEPKF